MKLTKEVVKEISNIKKEPKWMLDFRLTSLDAFSKSSNPSFGPKLDIEDLLLSDSDKLLQTKRE